MNSSCLIVIPARNEEACLPETLTELLEVLPENCRIAVGLNACTDESAAACDAYPAFVGETDEAGYGHGCVAAIEAAARAGFEADAYLFFAADGANSPEDALRLIAEFENDPTKRFVLGLRRFRLGSWLNEFGRALPNLILGLVCRILGGQFFHDLGPLRLIERRLFEEMQLKEMVWGWTIEAQIRAAQLGENIVSLPVEEHPRRAGEQKVSGVSLIRSSQIGWEIAKAGWRTRFRKE